MSDSKDKIIAKKRLREGLMIYQTGRSKFWYIRLRDPYRKCYIVRSSKETSRVDAIAAANEFSASFFSRGNQLLASEKASSFEYYAQMMLRMQQRDTKWPDSDRKLLNRKNDGILHYFGKCDITKITTKMVREYLAVLDENRIKPLAASTRAKHVIIIRKVLVSAAEEGVLKTIPLMPKQRTIDSPRRAFSGREYKLFMQTGDKIARRRDKVRGVTVTMHHMKMFRFIVYSFLRPTVGELFGIKHQHVERHGDPHHLKMRVTGGKTGARVSISMPIGAMLYQSLLNPNTGKPFDSKGYVWMPEYSNRTTAINTARRIFNHILEAAELDEEIPKLSPYSLRHYSLQNRVLSSKGEVNIYGLAKNAGTSVDQLERFYLKSMEPSDDMIRNLQS